MGALAPIVPDRVIAAGEGGPTLIAWGGYDENRQAVRHHRGARRQLGRALDPRRPRGRLEPARQPRQPAGRADRGRPAAADRALRRRPRLGRRGPPARRARVRARVRAARAEGDADVPHRSPRPSSLRPRRRRAGRAVEQRRRLGRRGARAADDADARLRARSRATGSPTPRPAAAASAIRSSATRPPCSRTCSTARSPSRPPASATASCSTDGGRRRRARRASCGRADERRPRDPQRRRHRRHGRRGACRRCRHPRRAHRRGRRGAGGGHRDRRHRQGRHARLHRHPQPLRLHAARRPARGERRAPGRHARGRRQLRLRLLPAPRQGARAEGDLRALGRRPAHLDVGGGLLRAARGGGAGDQRAQPRARTARSGCRWSGSRTGRRGRTSCTKMRYLLDEALEQGAWGYSTGLEYAAERGADEDELVSMCEVCGRRHGIYATHTRLRDEGADVAVEEALRTAERSGVQLQVSHLVPRNGLDSARRCIELVDEAAAGGMDIAFDMHTRLYGTTFLLTALPPWALEDPSRLREVLGSERAAARDARLREHPQRRRRLEPHRAARQRHLARLRAARHRRDRRRARSGAARRRLRPPARRRGRPGQPDGDHPRLHRGAAARGVRASALRAGLGRDDDGAGRPARRPGVPRRLHLGRLVPALLRPAGAGAEPAGGDPAADEPAGRADRDPRPRRPPSRRPRRRRRLRPARIPGGRHDVRPEPARDGDGHGDRQRRRDAERRHAHRCARNGAVLRRG